LLKRELNMKLNLLPLFFGLLISTPSFSQYTAPDCGALEEIILERYYISDANDATDEDGGQLAEGSVTWRVYVDLKPGYVLQTVFGRSNNPLRIETSTEFFNNEDRGEEFGDAIPSNRLGDNTVALDSYLTLGAASDAHMAVLKEVDDDGQIVAGEENDGGSEEIEGGLLVNAPADIGIPLTQADGLIEGEIISEGTGQPASITTIGLDASMFGDENSSDPLLVDDGAWAVLGGLTGPTEDNIILVAQITTTGELTLELNLRVGIPEDLQCNTIDCHENIDFVFEKTAEQEVPSIANDRICDLPSPVFLSVQGESFSDQGFEIFPNPSKNSIMVALSPEREKSSSFRIFDLFGRQVNAGVSNQRFGGILTIDVSRLAAGTYLLQIENDGEFATRRFVKN
jgi:hypothetical protein